MRSVPPVQHGETDKDDSHEASEPRKHNSHAHGDLPRHMAASASLVPAVLHIKRKVTVLAAELAPANRRLWNQVGPSSAPAGMTNCRPSNGEVTVCGDQRSLPATCNGTRASSPVINTGQP